MREPPRVLERAMLPGVKEESRDVAVRRFVVKLARSEKGEGSKPLGSL